MLHFNCKIYVLSFLCTYHITRTKVLFRSYICKGICFSFPFVSNYLSLTHWIWLHLDSETDGTTWIALWNLCLCLFRHFCRTIYILYLFRYVNFSFRRITWREIVGCDTLNTTAALHCDIEPDKTAWTAFSRFAGKYWVCFLRIGPRKSSPWFISVIIQKIPLILLLQIPIRSKGISTSNFSPADLEPKTMKVLYPNLAPNSSI